MTIKVFRVVESTEDGDNLLGYGWSDEELCSLRIGTKIINYYSDSFYENLDAKTAFDKMVQEQTDDLRYYRVEYQEYDLGNMFFVFGKEVAVNNYFVSSDKISETIVKAWEKDKPRMVDVKDLEYGKDVSNNPEYKPTREEAVRAVGEVESLLKEGMSMEYIDKDKLQEAIRIANGGI